MIGIGGNIVMLIVFGLIVVELCEVMIFVLWIMIGMIGIFVVMVIWKGFFLNDLILVVFNWVFLGVIMIDSLLWVCFLIVCSVFIVVIGLLWLMNILFSNFFSVFMIGLFVSFFLFILI